MATVDDRFAGQSILATLAVSNLLHMGPVKVASRAGEPSITRNGARAVPTDSIMQTTTRCGSSDATPFAGSSMTRKARAGLLS